MGRKNRPLNPKKDFDTPVKKDTDKPTLPGTEEQEPVRSPVVQHGRMSAHFVRFVPDRTKDRSRVVSMDFSLELEDAHEGHLPREIEDEWKHFKRGSVKRTDPSGMGTQDLQLATVPDSSWDLEVPASLKTATISRITQKGKGKERKTIRLQMRFLTSFTSDVERFCRNNYDETVWLVMKEKQLSLGEGESATEGQ